MLAWPFSARMYDSEVSMGSGPVRARFDPEEWNSMRHVGVDGCRSGWVAVTRNALGLKCELFPRFADLVSAFSTAERILVDIPIGLPWSALPIRPCDQSARRILGAGRKSSVFPVPCREALAVGKLDLAQRINLPATGRSIGAQTWGISPKIAEVDIFLQAAGDRGRNIFEIHPEVCFWALAGRKPMKHSKKTAGSRAERVKVLAEFEPGISVLLDEVLSNTLRKDLQVDDVLDAAVAFVTAEARHGVLSSVDRSPSHGGKTRQLSLRR